VVEYLSKQEIYYERIELVTGSSTNLFIGRGQLEAAIGVRTLIDQNRGWLTNLLALSWVLSLDIEETVEQNRRAVIVVYSLQIRRQLCVRTMSILSQGILCEESPSIKE
jgi:hypothetical protein